MKNCKINWLQLIFTSVIPLIAWMLFIFLLSHREKVAFTENYAISFSIFKSLHIAEYAILFLLWLRFFHLVKIKSKYFLALILTFVYGLSDEFHQSFIFGREGKLLDACVDGLGGLIAWLFIKKNQILKKIVFKTR